MEIQYILRGIKYDYDVGEVKEIIGTFSSDKAARDYFKECKSNGSAVEQFKKQFNDLYEEETPMELIPIRDPIPYKHLKPQLTKEQLEEYKFQNQDINAYNQGIAIQNDLIKTNYNAKKYQYVLDCLKVLGYSGHETNCVDYEDYEIESVKFFG